MNNQTKKFTAYLFVVMISVICVGMFYNAKTIGGAMLKRYGTYLPANYGKIDVVKAVIKSTEKGVNDSVIGEAYFIELNGLLHKVNGNQIVNDVDTGSTIYRLGNGQLTFAASGVNQSGGTQRIQEIYSKATEKGMDMLYVQAPFKQDKYNNILPWEMMDYTNINMDKRLDELKEANIPYIDLRQVIQDEQLVYEEMFYNTDHHWRIEAGLWASHYVQGELNKQFGTKCGLENTEIGRFESVQMKESFLGSQGRRVGRIYGGIDDFQYFIPKFETSYEMVAFNSDGSLELRNTGSFEDVMVTQALIQDKSVAANRYAVYFGRDWPLLSITNHKVQEGKVLVVQDSFGLPFSAFTSLAFRHTDIIDLRHFGGSIYEHLDENQYDVVLIVYGT